MAAITTRDAAPHERIGHRSIVLVAAVLALLLAGLSLRWYAHNATAFDTGTVVNASVSQAVPGASYSFGLAPELPDVEVTGAEVILDGASGPATTGAFICESGSIGSVAGPLSDYCTPVALVGSDLSSVPEGSQLIVSIAPQSADPVLALGLKIWFEDGWRTGRQTLPLNVVVYNELSAG